ncbi:Rv3235 family protein [Isoptericola sp. NPDC019482]|uniref:Rv3235 family protein n=1 Tax=Isoptericola sp. NPDC019482 TaxID=3154688 RepID=UPI0034701CE4
MTATTTAPAPSVPPPPGPPAGPAAPDAPEARPAPDGTPTTSGGGANARPGTGPSAAPDGEADGGADRRTDAAPDAPDDVRSPARHAVRVSAPPRPTGPAGYPEASTRPASRPRHVRVGAEGVRRAAADDEDGPARPLRETAPAPLPDPTAQCCTVVRAAVEVLRGERPAAQLARWVTPQVRDQLAERARIGLAHDLLRHEEPHRPVQVRRVRLVRLGDDVAEATVVLDDDGRVRAAAVRLEARRGAWRVAVLEVG